MLRERTQPRQITTRINALYGSEDVTPTQQPQAESHRSLILEGRSDNCFLDMCALLYTILLTFFALQLKKRTPVRANIESMP